MRIYHAHGTEDPPLSASPRKATNVSLDADLLAQARELNVNLSRAAADGISRAIKAECERRWLLENAEAIEASNDYVEKHGLPLERFRQF